MKDWWDKQTRSVKIVVVVVAALVAIGVIGGIASVGKKKEKKTSTSTVVHTVTATTRGTATEETKTQTAKGTNESSNNGPLVRGSWNGDCNQFSAGDLDACRALRVTRVTCQWRDDHVHMTVVFKNPFGAHVTVHMNPIYKLKNAGLHGNGLSSIEDVGLDSGERRVYETDLEPAGVSGQPRITLCRPGVDTLSGVELG